MIINFGRETGRAGQDSNEAEAILYYGKGANQHILKAVKNYGENQSRCRRILYEISSDVGKFHIVACRCCAPLCVCAK